ncbi:MAG: tripartite tricarboxylate transporter substrate binding protein [Deltaproteobacteria bacterium]|nr:tripartite tricarboxylate transporter substrate binding protein [Deltaproteobacteria bacterium]
MRNNKIMMVVWSLFFVFGLITPGFSEDFPKKPIRMIIAYSAGGGTDVLARAFQKPFEKELGTRILIENIPAGTTKVATMELMKAKPDGYTIILMPDRAWVAYYYSKTYDTQVWEKLTPIGNITTEPYGFVEVRAESPYKTWVDLVKAAKENPGKLTCGGPGAGGMMELIMNDITKAAGVETRYVPFAGAGPSKTALLGGHIDFRVCQPTEAITMIRAGKTRGLAVSTDKRMEALPDVPTFKELGIGESIILTRSIWGPSNLPQNIVNIMTKAIERASKDPDFIKVIEEQLLYTVEYRPSDRVREDLIDFHKAWGAKLAASYK